jgi:hypothetical protein
MNIIWDAPTLCSQPENYVEPAEGEIVGVEIRPMEGVAIQRAYIAGEVVKLPPIDFDL